MTVDEAMNVEWHVRVNAELVPEAGPALETLAAEVHRLRAELLIAFGPAPRPISGTVVEVSTAEAPSPSADASTPVR